MIGRRGFAVGVLLCSVVWMPCDVQADVIELANGDTIRAKVVEITRETLTIHHEVMGTLKIPRARVRAMVFEDVQPQPVPKSPRKSASKPKAKSGETTQETPKQIIDRLVNKDFGPKSIKEMEKNQKHHQTPEEVIEELRQTGISKEIKTSLQMALPGFSTPEVQGYFNDRVGGLMDGTIDISTIRKDAINARTQLQDIMGDLGTDAAALQGYYSILDHFIEETDPNLKAK